MNRDMTSMDELETTIDTAASGTTIPSERMAQVGEGRAGVILGVAILGAIGALIAALVMIPDFLDWIISIGLWLLVILVILSVIFGILAIFFLVGISIFYLAKKTPPQGPEVSYSIEMVKEPPKNNI